MCHQLHRFIFDLFSHYFIVSNCKFCLVLKYVIDKYIEYYYIVSEVTCVVIYSQVVVRVFAVDILKILLNLIFRTFNLTQYYINISKYLQVAWKLSFHVEQNVSSFKFMTRFTQKNCIIYSSLFILGLYIKNLFVSLHSSV